MSYVVYWLKRYDGDGVHGPVTNSHFKPFKDLEMMEALTFANSKRKETGVSHVTMSSNDPNQVGQMGVESVEGGRTPDGEIYDWSKQHRGGQRA